MKLRAYKTFTQEEKAEMYSMAQNKMPDGELMIKFNCDEDTLYHCISDVFVSAQKQAGYSNMNLY